MAHNIEYNATKGAYSFVEAFKRELAWHRLGQRFDQDGITISEAITACNADFEVSKQPIVALTPELVEKLEKGESLTPEEVNASIIEGKKATMRLDNNRSLGIVSDFYGIVQNSDAFQFIDQLVGGNITGEDQKPIIDAAGLLGNGERIFVTAKFPEEIKLDNAGNDIVQLYVIFTTSHDGTGSVNAMVSPVRVVCNNTLNLALKSNEGKLSLRHTSGILDRLDLRNAENAKFAYSTLNLYDVYVKSFKERIEALQSIKLSDSTALDIVRQVFMPKDQYAIFQKTGKLDSDGISYRTQNIVNAATKSLYEGIGQTPEQEGTGLWLVNGISSLYQNHTNTETTKNPTKFFDSVTTGSVSQKVNEAMRLVLLSNEIFLRQHVIPAQVGKA